MKAFIFPGQASQFEGMGKDMYEAAPLAKNLLEEANQILGYRITDIMFEGTAEELKQTKITQPAVFLHSIVKSKLAGEDFKPSAVAGHSLGEFSALVAAGALNFEDGLKLVQTRALAMQKACEATESTMAAIVGLEDEIVERICDEVEDVVAANYNCPGQLVISGSVSGINSAVEKLKAAGARRAIVLAVGGAFHSPFMQPAQEALAAAINSTNIQAPICPIYQNVNAAPQTNPDLIKQNLIDQLISPVKWTQTMHNMIQDGVTEFIEVGGTGKVLQGFVKRVDRSFPTRAL